MVQPTNDATPARIEALLGQILDRVDAIDRRQRELEARLDALDAAEADGATDAEEVARPQLAAGTARSLSRRKLLTGAAGLTAAGVAAAASSSPAAATNGQPVLAAQNNTATAATTISASGSATSALDLINTNASGAALYGQIAGSSPFSGPSYLGALIGNSQTQRGVVGLSAHSIGVVGRSSTDVGVTGQGGHTGVQGQGDSIGVAAQSVEGTALIASSDHVNLRLDTAAGRSAPTGDATAHYAGELVIDGAKGVWLCVANGTPGTWRRISGPSTAGSFHVLPAPARIYDSRPGSAPAVGSKTPLTNTPRVLSCNVNSSGVPAGATAVALTVLLVNAANTNGNMTVWANGAPRPQANTMVWGAGSGRYTSSTISAIDAQTRLQVVASAATDIVLDVVGYYR